MSFWRRLLPAPILISGCVQPTVLLERYPLLTMPWGQICIHHFLRSDEDRELHNHPWSFVSLILAGGYVEQRPLLRQRKYLARLACDRADLDLVSGLGFFPTERVRIRPGSIIFRPAWWAHRVELEFGRDAWTLIFVTRKTQPWGFFTIFGWVHNQLYHRSAACADASPARME